MTSPDFSRTLEAVVPSRDAAEIAAWLQSAFAKALDCAPADVPLDQPADGLGLDSLQLIRVIGKLSDWLGHECATTLFYEYETLLDASRHLATLVGRRDEQAVSPLEVVVAASFTAEPLAEPLALHLDALHGASAVAFAPYNQVFQALLDPTSRLNTHAGAAIALVRIEDWFRYAPEIPDDARFAQAVAEFVDALKAASAVRRGPLLVAVCPTERAPERRAFFAGLEATIQEAATALPHLQWVDLAGLSGYGAFEVFDAERDALGHIPYTPACYAALAGVLARAIYGLRRVPAKVIVLDCDNTLWDGVCGEDGAEGVKVGPERRALQAFMRAQRQAGRLLALCSKNVEADVWAVFERNGEMAIRRDELSAWRINWQAKSQNLRELAGELNLGLDAFVFVDDNPAECAEVRANAPEVTVVELGALTEGLEGRLSRHWAFDVQSVTDEDARRADMYRQNAERERLRGSATSFEDFLAQLALTIEVTPLAEADHARAAQLTERTNQFNATTVRRTAPALAAWLQEPGRAGWRVSVTDRFGDYGFVGLMLAAQSGDRLVADTFLLSCRVLGKRVEHAMIQALADHAAARGLAELALPFAPSPRNQPVRAFFEGLAARALPDVGDSAVTLAVAGVAERLAGVSAADVAQRAPDGDSAAGHGPAPSEGLGAIARWENAEAIVAQLRGRKQPRPDLETPYASPRTLWQRKLAELWSDLLGVDRVGVHDSFFELGGDSLQGADLTAALWKLGVPDGVALSTLTSPTIAALSQAIEAAQRGQAIDRNAALLSLEAHASLDPAIRVTGPIEVVAQPGVLFVTGGTGYVGAFLLAGLLRRTEAQLLCHVRASSAEAGHERLVRNLRRYDLWRAEWSGRVVPVLGDLQQPRLGMADADWEHVAAKAEALYHNGAWVNFVFPYEKLAAANVGATEEVLRLSLHRRVKPLHFVSTLGVLMSGGYGRDRQLYEDDVLDHSEDLPNGYEQTKWVADKLVRTAMDRGVPASIYRLGMLSGLSACGTYHKVDEFLPSFLKGCVQLGSFPMIDSKIEMVPADFVVEALVRLSLEPTQLGKVYQMNHPAALTDAQFAAWMQGYGYPLRRVPWDVWKRELFGAGPQLRDNALYPYLEFLRGLQGHQTYMPEMDMRNFLTGIADMELHCPPQDVLLQRYFDHFVQVGYLPRPAAVFA